MPMIASCGLPRSKSGRKSAPRPPQPAQTKRGSISDSRTSSRHQSESQVPRKLSRPIGAERARTTARRGCGELSTRLLCRAERRNRDYGDSAPSCSRPDSAAAKQRTLSFRVECTHRILSVFPRLRLRTAPAPGATTSAVAFGTEQPRGRVDCLAPQRTFRRPNAERARLRRPGPFLSGLRAHRSRPAI